VVNSKLTLGVSSASDNESESSSAHGENGSEVPPITGVSSSSQVKGPSKNRGGRGGPRRQNQPELSESEKNKIKIYKLKYDKYLKLKPTTNSPFDALIKATQVMNAEQFKLPPELHPNEQLPFSWKWKDERQDDNETYPRNCIICTKSCRGVPAVACDFCPSVYHLDCLDPPLCEMPTVSSHYEKT